jgi:hypothetical protein
MTQSDASPLEIVLARYLEIQKEEIRLKEEKATLQGRLAAHMEAQQQTQWTPEVAGQPLVVRYRRTVRVSYDEQKLQERLGERYPALLTPDLRKLRPLVDELTPQLSIEWLTKVGSPAPEKVKAAIESGLVRQEDFKGAFRKEESVSISVARRPAH